jgi:putative tricarboxylic transport membrane protein
VNRDTVFGAVCLALAAGYYLTAAAIPDSALSDAVGPQGLPKTYAVVLGALSLVLIARSMTARGGHRKAPDHPPAGPSPFALAPSVIRVVGMLLIGALYLAVVPYAGYILSLAGLIAATTYYQGGGVNGRVALVAVSGALVFWVLFVAVLGIPHPPGIWPALF